MRKKRVHRKQVRTRRRSSAQIRFWYFFGIVFLVFAGVWILRSFQSEGGVLGTVYLVDKGSDDSGGSSGSGSGSSDSGGSDSGSGSSDSEESDSGSGSSSGGSSTSTNSTSTIKTETRIRIPTVVQQPEIFDTEDDDGIRTRMELKPDETRTEVRFSETERIRTRTKDGRTRIDITSGGIKVRLEQRNDRMIVKAEQEDGSEVELEDDTIFKIDERLAKDQIKIATAGADKLVLQRGATRAVTEFPLSIDLVTNALIVNTPVGSKQVTILPDQAVENLLAANIVNRLGGAVIVEQVATGSAMSLADIITLGEQNGVSVYQIQGVSDQNLLGFIPVAIEKEVTVSAENGEIIATDQSLLSRILDAVSF